MTRWPRRLTLAANQTELDVRKRALAHRCDTLRWNVLHPHLAALAKVINQLGENR